MERRTPTLEPPRDGSPFRKPVIRPDQKEDQADSGPDRDNPITQESKHPAPKHEGR
jgi:hypothetical protein